MTPAAPPPLPMHPHPAFYPDSPELGAGRCAENEPPVPNPKMKFIHTRRYLLKGEIVQLDCDTQCNFILLSDAEYAAYEKVHSFHYYGGTFKQFPARIAVPESGYWNIVIDLAGAKAEIHYNITVILDDGV